MARVLIIYFSKTGNTEKMAHQVAEGVSREGIEPVLKKVETASVDELLSADGVIFGSPTYFGTMAAEIKSFLDESVKHFGKLNTKIGVCHKRLQTPISFPSAYFRDEVRHAWVDEHQT